MIRTPTCVLALLLPLGIPQQSEKKPFWVAGVDDPEQVRVFLIELQRAVAADDARGVARLARYPLEVALEPDKKRYRVTSAAEFEQLYHRVFTSCLRRVIAAATHDGLHASWRGIMLGRGAVWFAPQQSGPLRIITINGPIFDEALCQQP